MLVILVYGISEQINQEEIGKLYHELLSQMVEFKELELQKGDIFCYFQSDRFNRGLGNEILVEVKGLSIEPETEILKKDIAGRLNAILLKYFPDANRVGCLFDHSKLYSAGSLG